MFVVGIRTFSDYDQLEKLVIKLSEQYNKYGYAEDFGGNPVNDPEYDELYKTLKKGKPDSEAFKGTTPGHTQITGKEIIHDPPMTSIAKADGEDRKEIYESWLADCAKRLGLKVEELEVVQSWKRDGLAARFNYKKGKFVSAGLRPRDGVHGTDITQYAKYIRGVPMELALPLTLSLNGELECWKADFEAVNAEMDAAGEEPYKNPRNYTAGQMGRDDPEEMKDGKIRVTFHSISGFDNWHKHYHTEIERAKWANQEHGLDLKGAFVQVQPHDFQDLLKMEIDQNNLPYEVDGVVLKVADLEAQEQLGNTGDDPVKEPRGALAWKFKEPTAEAKNNHLEWNASRTGRVVPTAIFESAVKLAGTMVSRATANNYGWAKAMGIGKGTILRVQKAGKIIPNIKGVVSDAVECIDAPTKCPTCGYKLRVHENNGNQDLMCDNPDCGAKQTRAWQFFFQNLDAKGLGLSAMERILEGGKVKQLPDFFTLGLQDLLDCGFSDRQAALALATIWKVEPDKDNELLIRKIKTAQKRKLKVQGWKFFAALGIPGAGKTVGKILIDVFRDFDKIIQVDQDDLLEIDGIGPKTAETILIYFQEHEGDVRKLLKYFELELPATGKHTGKTFVLTGSFDPNKSHWQKRIEAEGGKIASSVGSKVDFLVLGDPPDPNKPTTKEQAARKHGVPMINVQQLEKML